jgi:hypothetical protein
MLSYVRQAITTNGGPPQSFRLVDAWRELVEILPPTHLASACGDYLSQKTGLTTALPFQVDDEGH